MKRKVGTAVSGRPRRAGQKACDAGPGHAQDVALQPGIDPAPLRGCDETGGKARRICALFVRMHRFYQPMEPRPEIMTHVEPRHHFWRIVLCRPLHRPAGWPRKAGAVAPWRCASRNEALFVRQYGSWGPGSSRSSPTSVTMDSVRAAIHGADAVVNCVGIRGRAGQRTSSTSCRTTAAGADRPPLPWPKGSPALRGRSRASGADPNSKSQYAHIEGTRARGWGWQRSRRQFNFSAPVESSFGAEDQFFNRFAANDAGSEPMLAPCSAAGRGSSRSMSTT